MSWNSILQKKTRNSEALLSFVTYCVQHPDQRFWQALRNWSKWSFILGSSVPPYQIDDTNIALVDDTFYVEGLDGTREQD